MKKKKLETKKRTVKTTDSPRLKPLTKNDLLLVAGGARQLMF